MILDKFLDYNTKVIIAIICGALWIYFRTSDCYNLIPRKHLFPVLFVSIWIYLNYMDPLFLPIGLLILITYMYYEKNIKKCLINYRNHNESGKNIYKYSSKYK